MVLMLVPDETVGSNDPQEIPSLGVTVPVPVAETDRTRAEWEKLIKKTGAPIVVRDVRSEEKLDALEEQTTKIEKEA